MDAPPVDDTYLLLLLADSNLPTGAFVASAGLESFATHGFLARAGAPSTGTLDFVRASVRSYAAGALSTAAEAYRIAARMVDAQDALPALCALDAFYHASLPNHVARRASTAQGLALLSLLSKGFAPLTGERDAGARLVDELKLLNRRGDMQGHLPMCWGVITAVLGLSCGA